jgi:hypothetical protein
MANKGPKTIQGKIWKDATGDGRKPPTVENTMGSKPTRRKGKNKD